MATNMTKPKRRKKKHKEIYPSQEFKNLKGPKRSCLIQERKKNRLTQQQLGELVGCSGSTISHLESGRMNPNFDISLQLEIVLKTAFNDLFPDL